MAGSKSALDPTSPLPETWTVEERRLVEPFYTAAAADKLVLPNCQQCESFHWYPLLRCPYCQNPDWLWKEIRPLAHLYTWVRVGLAFDPAVSDNLPYLVGLVEPDDAPEIHLVSNLMNIGAEELRIGMPLVATFGPPVASPSRLPIFTALAI